MSVNPTRTVGETVDEIVDEHVVPGTGRLEIASSTRRHRSLVARHDAAVVLGVLGYRLEGLEGQAAASELLARAYAWQAHHDPHAVRDPEAAGTITWSPAQDAAEAYLRCPPAYRAAFSAFTICTRPPRSTDTISWRTR